MLIIRLIISLYLERIVLFMCMDMHRLTNGPEAIHFVMIGVHGASPHRWSMNEFGSTL